MHMHKVQRESWSLYYCYGVMVKYSTITHVSE